MSAALNWASDGRDWPHRAASRFVESDGLRFHVQVMGAGPTLLLVHGTGASTHSWRDLLPLLAAHFTVVAPDLPGHGFTAMPPRASLSLPGMARALAGLLQTMGVAPALAAGHSAGAAILIRMALDKRITPATIVSFNGALLPFTGLAGQIFSPLAKLLVLNPFVPRLFAWRAQSRSAVERLLKDTGSNISAAGVDLYAKLFANAGHVEATLAMMANWDLAPLARDLPKLATPLLLVTGERDKAVPSDDTFVLRDKTPGARVSVMRRAGHLAHEEQPAEAVALIVKAASDAGVLPRADP